MLVRGKGNDGRDRTPSPMYLELQGGQQGRGLLNEHEDYTYESGSGGARTPRGQTENMWNLMQNLPGKEKSNMKMASMNAQFDINRQLQSSEPGRFQEQVWSTFQGSGNHAGYVNDYPSRFPEIPGPLAPYRSQEYVSSTLPVTNGRSMANNYNGSGLSKEALWALENPPLGGQLGQRGGLQVAAVLRNEKPGRSLDAQVFDPQVFCQPCDKVSPPQPVCSNVNAGGNQENVVSIGSRGHPHTCERACKYVWKLRGCRDGANCAHCHLCRPQKNKQARENEPTKPGAPPPSVGSIGHPHSCAHACKYNGKKAGCKDGHLCNRCHLCRWSRCTDRPKDEEKAEAEGQAKIAPKTCEMATQTTVDKSVQCDLGEEPLRQEDLFTATSMDQQFGDYVSRTENGSVVMGFSC
jgi:hypothetical protein